MDVSPRRPVIARRFLPTEADEQRVLAAWLDAMGILWAHPPNSGYRAGLNRDAQVASIAGARLKRLGVKAGLPDILIFQVPPAEDYASVRGVAIELKRREGGAVSDEHKAWLKDLRDVGWLTRVCLGAADAIGWLQILGFGTAPLRR